jgi:phosphoribosylformimino-5-aminoimidazole carboxamide ribotide isomerase
VILFPAIDLMGGKVVRLTHGDKNAVTIYSDDPVAQALIWQGEGAEWIHLVDLDRAFGKGPGNQAVVQDILKALKIPVQLGGGLRSTGEIEEALSWGVERVILGTRAVRDRAWLSEVVQLHGERVAVAIDARKGIVEIAGWVEATEVHATEFAAELARLGVARVIVTDIDRDGTMGGLNLGLAERIARGTKLKVIASGGAGSLAELEKLKVLQDAGIEGLVVGKALYEGSMTLAGARTLLRGH